jgi:hypothetical protein
LGVLRESQLISAREIGEKTWIYKASTTDFFLKYHTDMYPLMAAFRVHHQKSNPVRFKYD